MDREQHSEFLDSSFEKSFLLSRPPNALVPSPLAPRFEHMVAVTADGPVVLTEGQVENNPKALCF